MTRILLRSKKDPFEVVGPGEGIRRDIFGTNAGNLIFSHAAHKLLATSGTEVVPSHFSAKASEAERINEEYDVFVVPLANAFRRSFLPRLRELTALIERLTIPVVVLGVGVQTTLDYDLGYPEPINDEVKRFVAAVLDRSASIGVRGECTERYLHHLGFTDVEVIGCPSMFLDGPQLRVTPPGGPLTRESRIALNASRSAMKTGDVGGFVTANHRRYPHLRYVAQETKDLELLYWGDTSQVEDRHNSAPVNRTHPLFSENKVRVYLDPPTWIRDLRGFDFAFGTRIHGNIAALLAGTPAVVLCHDSRTLELCRYFDIPHRAITDVPRDVDAADLYAHADVTGLNSGHAERFRRFTGFLERNGLDHVFSPGQDEGREFDKRVAETAYPPAVDAWTSAEEGVAARIGWLKRHQQLTQERLDALQRSVADLERRVADLAKARPTASGPRRSRARRLLGRAARRVGLR
jgi:hypothetical protein